METFTPPKIDMDADTPVTPTPTLRSAVTVPRSGTVPVAAPRTITAATPPTVARSSTRAAATPAPPKPHRTRCPLCCRSHRLQHCSIFKGMLPVQRQKVAQAHGHCLNCLAQSHATLECESDTLCRLCERPHHTLLHRNAGHPGSPTVLRRRTATRRSQSNRVARHPEAGWSWRPLNTTSTRNQIRPQPHRPTGLSGVVATLQALQRLLG
ncbi:uncharacterized protein LOC126764495 [Bactrocera neohumeralis]|uniref:uncharacterized protein LOC126764495 n=1 Tax=Bactrocera neohumeralis TaxID=98809 RepID=UPI002165B3F9|nr:uncharacterized protein LOC126764495 [Bactrocera neohumeralis]